MSENRSEMDESNNENNVSQLEDGGSDNIDLESINMENVNEEKPQEESPFRYLLRNILKLIEINNGPEGVEEFRNVLNPLRFAELDRSISSFFAQPTSILFLEDQKSEQPGQPYWDIPPLDDETFRRMLVVQPTDIHLDFGRMMASQRRNDMLNALDPNSPLNKTIISDDLIDFLRSNMTDPNIYPRRPTTKPNYDMELSPIVKQFSPTFGSYQTYNFDQPSTSQMQQPIQAPQSHNTKPIYFTHPPPTAAPGIPQPHRFVAPQSIVPFHSMIYYPTPYNWRSTQNMPIYSAVRTPQLNQAPPMQTPQTAPKPLNNLSQLEPSQQEVQNYVNQVYRKEYNRLLRGEPQSYTSTPMDFNYSQYYNRRWEDSSPQNSNRQPQTPYAMNQNLNSNIPMEWMGPNMDDFMPMGRNLNNATTMPQEPVQIQREQQQPMFSEFNSEEPFFNQQNPQPFEPPVMMPEPMNQYQPETIQPQLPPQPVPMMAMHEVMAPPYYHPMQQAQPQPHPSYLPHPTLIPINMPPPAQQHMYHVPQPTFDENNLRSENSNSIPSQIPSTQFQCPDSASVPKMPASAELPSNDNEPPKRPSYSQVASIGVNANYNVNYTYSGSSTAAPPPNDKSNTNDDNATPSKVTTYRSKSYGWQQQPRMRRNLINLNAAHLANNQSNGQQNGTYMPASSIPVGPAMWGVPSDNNNFNQPRAQDHQMQYQQPNNMDDQPSTSTGVRSGRSQHVNMNQTISGTDAYLHTLQQNMQQAEEQHKQQKLLQQQQQAQRAATGFNYMQFPYNFPNNYHKNPYKAYRNYNNMRQNMPNVPQNGRQVSKHPKNN